MDDMFFAAECDLPLDRFIAPRVEVEAGVHPAKAAQGPDVTLDDVLAATEFVAPAIEIIDARIEQFDRDTKAMRKVFDTISDFAANAGIIVGPGRACVGAEIDLRWAGAILSKRMAWLGRLVRRWRARASGHRRSMARQQDCAVWRAVERGRCGARRAHLPAPVNAVRGDSSRQTMARSAVSVSDLF